MKKKLMEVLLACALVIGTVTVLFGGETVWAEDGEAPIETEWRYYDNGNGVTIIKYYGSDTEVVIPESLGGKKVTEIEGGFAADSAADDKITSITIPSTVTTIKERAFRNCSKLISIQIPDSVTTIGKNAFWNCFSLTSIYIPDSVTTIGEGAFTSCISLTSVRLSNSISVLESGLFSNMGNYGNYSSLTSISIPNSVTTIGENAFSGCRNLVSIDIPDSVTTIKAGAFSFCSNLVSIDIPDSVATIEKGTFSSCTSLTSISFPNSITVIEPIFGECDNLTSVRIPKSVIRIEQGAFGGNCKNLKDIYYDGSREQWEKIDKKLVDFSEINIHCNDSESAQSIKANNITKTYGAKAFYLNAKSSAGAALTYNVSDKKVATVDKKGKVTIKRCGITNITIKAPKKGNYKAAEKTIKLTVKPRTVTLSTAKSTKKKTANVKWKKNKEAQGYIIQCATDSKFKKNKVQTTINKGATASATVKKLKSGKKYYIRVCAYAKSGKTKVQGSWSKALTVKVKK